MEEEIEFTVKVRAIRTCPDSDPKWEVERIVQRLSRDGYVTSTEVLSQEVVPASPKEELKYTIYKRLMKESLGESDKTGFYKDRVFWIVDYSHGNDDPCIRIVEDVQQNKLITLMIRPVPTEMVQIRCMCITGHPVDTIVPIDQMTKTCKRLVKEHTCEPWPG